MIVVMEQMKVKTVTPNIKLVQPKNSHVKTSNVYVINIAVMVKMIVVTIQTRLVVRKKTTPVLIKDNSNVQADNVSTSI